MFDLRDSDRERFLERIDSALSQLSPKALLPFDLQVARVALEENNISILGECLASLAALQDPKYDPLKGRLETMLHKPQWLEHILTTDTHPSVLAYARDALLCTDAPAQSLSVAHVVGQLATFHQHQPNGMEKLLSAVELLWVSRNFLAQLEPDSLFMYNTTQEEVASTLAEVDEQISLYQQYLDNELFDPFPQETPRQETPRQETPRQETPRQAPVPSTFQPDSEASKKKKLDKFIARAAKDKEIAEKTRAKTELVPSSIPELPAPTARVSQTKLVEEVNLHNETLVRLEISELGLLAGLAATSSARTGAVRALQGMISNVPLRQSEKFTEKDIALFRSVLTDPVYQRMRKLSNANLGRAPSLGLVLQMHNQSVPVLCAAVQTDVNKLEPAFCIYLQRRKELGVFVEWLHRTLVDMIKPYRDVNAWEHLVRNLFGNLFYFLVACSDRPINNVWPFEDYYKCVSAMLK